MEIYKAITLALLFICVLPFVSGTQIEQEEVLVDLGEQAQIKVNMSYRELTQNKISYIVPFEVTSVEGKIDGEPITCTQEGVEIGTEILCETERREDFNAVITYNTGSLVDKRGEISEFTYSRSILEPIESYSLKVLLPEGSVIYKSNRSGFKSVSPDTDIIGSSGRRINVKWLQEDVELGSTVSFHVYYENARFFDSFPYIQIFAVVGAVLVAIFLGYFYFSSRKKTVSSVLPVLKEGEREVLEFIIDQGKECKQKKIVKNLDHSKAKISRIVKDLEERNLITKEKRGRTNVVKLKKELGDTEV